MSTTTQWSAPISPTAELRATLKRQRQSVSAVKRCQSEQRAIRFLSRNRHFQQANTVAAYISVTAEFPTSHLLTEILRRHKKLYLPVLEGVSHQHMRFTRLIPNRRLKKNRFGIPEPAQGENIDACRLDLVIMPLLGFDQLGNRLGMGGGYYDRTFAFSKQAQPMSRPFLLGLAYDIQEVTALAAQPWDVPLDAILSESGIRYFSRN